MKRPLAAQTPVRTGWTTLVAVCQECDGGKRFAKSLRGAFKETKTRGTRVVKSSCLDVCPKRGVTVSTMRGGTTATCIVDDALTGVAAVDAIG